MRTTQRAGAVLMVFTLAVTLLSCSKGVTGTYLNTKDSKTTLELKSNGGFAVYEKSGSPAVATGTYKVQGTVITFSLGGDNNKSGSGKIEGDILTDPDGVTWKKQ